MEITEMSTERKNKTNNSRSPSPAQRQRGSYKKSKARSSSPLVGSTKNPEKNVTFKQGDTKKQVSSPRNIVPVKRKSKVKISSASNFEVVTKEKLGKDCIKSRGECLLKQTSQPSFCVNEKVLPPQEKISLDHLKNEVYTGDHRRLSFEKVHFCIEKSVDNSSGAESKRSYLVTYSSEDLKNQEGFKESLSFLQNLSSTSITTHDIENKRLNEGVVESKSAIRTLSGKELVLTPSMKLELEKSDITNENIEISELLHQTGENFEETKEIPIFQDDANEYDSEMSTDGELSRKEEMRRLSGVRISSKNSELNKKSASSLWKSREVEILNDVDYRQSVYHPAVSRRQTGEPIETEFRPKSKSIEDNFGFYSKTSENMVRSCSSNLKNKCSSPMFLTDKINCTNERSWGSNLEKPDGKPIYNSVLQDVPLYDLNRIRTKKERVSGALLRFTLKIIRLLALFNLWPGDNCYLLTSHSLKFAR